MYQNDIYQNDILKREGAWCGHLCPAGGLQECAMRVKDDPAKQGKRDKIKYVIWTWRR